MLLDKTKNLIKIFIILTTFLFHNFICVQVFSSSKNFGIEEVHKLLKQRKFDEAINTLDILSNKNIINAQYLYSQILYAGNITPQNFEKAYFWSAISDLGGFKNSRKIIDLLENYLDKKEKIEINENIKKFLEKHAMKKNKLAIIQIAKWHIKLSEEIDYINAYKWYNIAVASGIKSAAKKRDKIINELSAEEIIEAQKQSNDIFKKINKVGG